MGAAEKGSGQPRKCGPCKAHPHDRLDHPRKGVAEPPPPPALETPPGSWHHVDRVDFLLLFQMARFSQIQWVSLQPAGFPFSFESLRALEGKSEMTVLEICHKAACVRAAGTGEAFQSPKFLETGSCLLPGATEVRLRGAVPPSCPPVCRRKGP